jgi:hypothetical protein
MLKTKFCSFKSNCKRKNCNFAHSFDELNIIGCRYDTTCRIANCNYIHSNETREEYYKRRDMYNHYIDEKNENEKKKELVEKREINQKEKNLDEKKNEKLDEKEKNLDKKTNKKYYQPKDNNQTLLFHQITCFFYYYLDLDLKDKLIYNLKRYISRHNMFTYRDDCDENNNKINDKDEEKNENNKINDKDEEKNEINDNDKDNNYDIICRLVVNGFHDPIINKKIYISTDNNPLAYTKLCNERENCEYKYCSFAHNSRELIIKECKNDNCSCDLLHSYERTSDNLYSLTREEVNLHLNRLRLEELEDYTNITNEIIDELRKEEREKEEKMLNMKMDKMRI